MTQRPTGLPSPEQVIELLDGEFARAGYEIDEVRVEERSRPPRLRVIVDGDVPPDSDVIAQLSRSASALLDTLDAGGGGYVLEVSSPGVDRPLTEEKHFRRARGRKVDVDLADGGTVSGRLGETADGAVDLVISAQGGWTVRRIPLSQIRRAVVQVEFSAPSARELQLAGGLSPDIPNGG